MGGGEAERERGRKGKGETEGRKEWEELRKKGGSREEGKDHESM